MSRIFGYLGIGDNERVFVNTLGQSVVYDATVQSLGDHNADLQQALAVFVERTTTDHKLRYELPGGGYLQARGRRSRTAAVKAYGYWDVAFPLKDGGAEMAWDDVAIAYMSMQDYNRHLLTILAQDVNTVRHEILHRIFDNVQTTWTDPIYGSLTIVPLANGDAVVYPPVIGSTSEATEDHYLYSGYAAASVDNTNNPYKTLVGEMEHHFGKSEGNSNLVTFINAAQTSVTEDLTDFDEVHDRFVAAGANERELMGLPATLPGRIVGRTNGTWVCEWDWIPANYMLALHLDAPKPLIERVDEADTGLPTGLQLVAESVDHPLEASIWRHRFGFGVGNRLNGTVMFLTSGSSYTVPTAYDEPAL